MKRPPKRPPEDGPEPETSLIFDLLRGITDDPTDIYSRTRHLTPAEEVAGRRALAELLRTPKWPGPSRGGLSTAEQRERMFVEALHRLADLIDPANTSKRKIVFKNRRGLRQWGASLKIFHSIEDLVKGGLGVTEAVEQVHEKSGLSTRRIWKIWDLFTEQ